MICALDDKNRSEKKEEEQGKVAQKEPAVEATAEEIVTEQPAPEPAPTAEQAAAAPVEEQSAPAPEEQAVEAVIECLTAEQVAPESEPTQAAEEPATEQAAVPAEEPSDVEPAAVIEQAAAAPAEEPSDVEPAVVTEQALEQARPTFEIPQTEEGIMERMEFLSLHPEQSERLEIVALRKAFYRLHVAEAHEQSDDTAKTAAPPDAAQETKLLDEMTAKFQSLLTQIRDLRAKLQQDAEQQKELNAEKRQQIVERIRLMLQSPETISGNYQAFRRLQEDWKAAKPVPAQMQNELWHAYQFVTEQFYDLLKENNALRDYDFRKNLDKKTALCQAAEHLAAEIEQAATNNTLSANKLIAAVTSLQHMHDAYREIGPVEKSKREELWNRFKTASSTINRHHAKFFEAAKAQEKENLQKKTALCEAVEAITPDDLHTYNQWAQATQSIQALQAEWRTVGRAARRQNQALYERFRVACDKFFEARSQYFKARKKELALATQKRLQLIQAVEALKDSTDWQQTAAQIRSLQQQWKEAGPTRGKNAAALWERFNGACNHFFARLKEANPIGPRGSRTPKESPSMQPSPSAALQKQYQQLRSEVRTFETNIARLTASSKSGNALIEQMQSRVEALKQQLSQLSEQINAPQQLDPEVPAQEGTPAE